MTTGIDPLDPTELPPRIAILGAGVTGLTTAWHLARRGVSVEIFDPRPDLGGVVNTVRDGGWLRETGPNTLFENTAQITAFIDALGLGARRLEASPSAKKRYVVKHGRPVALPHSPLQFITTPLLSLGAKLSLLGEPFRRRAPADREENVAEFVRRRLGPEFLDYIVNPFVAGVYAGDPAGLSVRHAFPKLYTLEQEHGSMLRGSLARRNATGGPKGSMISFPDGLAEIPRALARDLTAQLRLNHRVESLRRTPEGWTVCTTAHGVRSEAKFTAVVCTLPPEALANLIFENVAGSAGLQAFRRVPQPPVATVFMGFRREDVAHPLDGFGLLNPAVEKRRILGTLFSSTLFPGRAPDGHVALTTFVGGTRQPEIARLDDERLAATVHAELTALLGVRAPAVYTRIQRWPHAIPQYVVGYQAFKDACAAVEAAEPGLFLGGTARDGVSLSNCITAGQRLADAALHRLPSP